MKGGKFFNNKQIFYNFKLINFLDKKIDGFKLFNIKMFEQRLELSSNFSINLYKNSKWLILNYLLDSIIPNNKNLKKRRLINIYFLDFISSYRGYRHSFGLPVNGQRTWTNAKSTFSANPLLRNYKLNMFKKSLLGLPVSDINNAFYLEQLNFLWKSQWELEYIIFNVLWDYPFSKNLFNFNAIFKKNWNIRVSIFYLFIHYFFFI